MFAILDFFDRVADVGGALWMAGNDGSASFAHHIFCDISKGTYEAGRPPLRTVALTSNALIVTALGNDVSHDAVFSEQLEYYLTE